MSSFIPNKILQRRLRVSWELREAPWLLQHGEALSTQWAGRRPVPCPGMKRPRVGTSCGHHVEVEDEGTFVPVRYYSFVQVPLRLTVVSGRILTEAQNVEQIIWSTEKGELSTLERSAL